MLSLVYGPHPIFKQKSAEVSAFDTALRELVENLFSLLHHENGVGMAAPMAGISMRIIVIHSQDSKLALINPTIYETSKETQTIEEASLSFPGISTSITRPASIGVTYQDVEGNPQKIEASGLLSTIIQHEMDYLEGRTFLDYVSKMKRDLLTKKTIKYQKMYPPHIHSEHCNH